MPNGSNLARIVLARGSVSFVNFANECPLIHTHTHTHTRRVCVIKSVDASNITTYCVHECEAANRIGMRSRRFVFTGHTNGAIQVCQLSLRLYTARCDPENSLRCGISLQHSSCPNTIKVYVMYCGGE